LPSTKLKSIYTNTYKRTRHVDLTTWRRAGCIRGVRRG